MKIVYLKHQSIDKQKWDECIANSQQGIAYAYSWYLDAVFNNWSALVMDDYEAVFPLTIQSKFGFSYFFNPIFAMQFGVFSTQELTKEMQQRFYKSLPKGIQMYDFSVNSSNQFCPKYFRVTQKECQYVDLNAPYNEIASNYSTNLKRNLNKAIKTNLTIRYSTSTEDVISLFQQNRGKNIKDIKHNHYNVLNTLILNGIEKEKIKIIECYDDREIIAAGFFSYANKRIIYHKGGTNNKGKKYGAMHLIVDFLIRTHQNSDWILDFGGSSIPSVKQFNRNFSKDQYTYLQLQKSWWIFRMIRKIKNSIK